MGITGAFGTTMDLERGTSRQWVMGRDGIKRWADSNEPVDKKPTPPNEGTYCKACGQPYSDEAYFGFPACEDCSA